MPFAFSEQGVGMLSSILKSERAIYVNIQMIRIFTKMRLMLTNTAEIKMEIEKIQVKLNDQDKNMEIAFQYLDELLEKKHLANLSRTRIGFMPDTI